MSKTMNKFAPKIRECAIRIASTASETILHNGDNSFYAKKICYVPQM